VPGVSGSRSSADLSSYRLAMNAREEAMNPQQKQFQPVPTRKPLFSNSSSDVGSEVNSSSRSSECSVSSVGSGTAITCGTTSTTIKTRKNTAPVPIRTDMGRPNSLGVPRSASGEGKGSATTSATASAYPPSPSSAAASAAFRARVRTAADGATSPAATRRPSTTALAVIRSRAHSGA
jgi:hypothetical protein